MKSILRLTAAACALVGLTAERASADIKYTLENVGLGYVAWGIQDAGTLNGWFITDDGQTALKDFHFDAPQVTVTNWLGQSKTFAAASYNYAPPDSNDLSDLGNTTILDIPAPYIKLTQPLGALRVTNELNLLFLGGLSATGTTSIVSVLSGEQQSRVGDRFVTGGYVRASAVAAVPEPSAVAVVALCAPALLAYGWRRRGTASAA